MNEIADARGAHRSGHIARALVMHSLECLLAALAQDADEIYRRIGVAQSRSDRFGIAQICLDSGDLADAAGRLKMERKVRPADGDAHQPALLRQSADDITADKPRSAEDRHQPVGAPQGFIRGGFIHGVRPISLARRCSNQPGRPCTGRAAFSAKLFRHCGSRPIDKRRRRPLWEGTASALVAELVDALVSGTSGESRGGSSPLQGTIS